jgi:lauroyl/myristoyl acyltransferase
MGKGHKKITPAKRTGYFLGRMAVFLCLALGRRLPLTWLYRVSELAGRLAFYLMGKRRKIVFDNLQLAFGSTGSRDGYRAIAKSAFCDSLKNVVEVAKLIFSGPPYIKGIMSIDGIEHLERALGLGRGVVAVSAHMGNFPLVVAPPFAIDHTGNRDQDILTTTAKLTKLIESYIRQYPTQWWWFHRRWRKSRKRSEQPLPATERGMQPCIH